MVKQKWGCIYRLTNTTNGMKYIGKTISYKKRMNKHKNPKSKTYLCSAVNKYGWDAFKQEILIDDVPEEDLNNLEICYIAVENTMVPNGYNLTPGGDGRSVGFKTSKETKEKQSKRRSEFLSKRKQFGTVTYHKRHKKWHVKSAFPEKKHIGIYITESKAREALKLYNATGKCMESDRGRKRRGEGSIYRRTNGRLTASITQNKKRKVGTFGTVEECEAFLEKCVKHFNSTGKQMEVSRKYRKSGTGSIFRRASGRYTATIKRNKKGKSKTFDTVEECEAFLENCRNNN